MKELKRDEEGVSPVIATILMVAITVVLAATLYMMVSDPGGAGKSPIAGTLTYNDKESHPSEGNATFHLNMNTPSSIDTTKVRISLLDSKGKKVGSIDADEINGQDDIKASNENLEVSITHIDSDPDELGDGDRIHITGDVTDPTKPQQDISHYEIVITMDGYTGQINAVIEY